MTRNSTACANVNTAASIRSTDRVRITRRYLCPDSGVVADYCGLVCRIAGATFVSGNWCYLLEPTTWGAGCPQLMVPQSACVPFEGGGRTLAEARETAWDAATA